MEIWKSESDKNKQTALIVGCVIAGILLIYLSYNYYGSDINNAGSGFVLGIILIFIGLYAFFSGKKQIITVDPNNRQIVVENISCLRNKKRLLKFNEIADIAIGYLGKKSNYVNFYYLVLKLKNGEEYSLFSPGYFYNGSLHKEIVEGWRERLWGYIQSS